MRSKHHHRKWSISWDAGQIYKAKLLRWREEEPGDVGAPLVFSQVQLLFQESQLRVAEVFPGLAAVLPDLLLLEGVPHLVQPFELFK